MCKKQKNKIKLFVKYVLTKGFFGDKLYLHSESRWQIGHGQFEMKIGHDKQTK